MVSSCQWNSDSMEPIYQGENGLCKSLSTHNHYNKCFICAGEGITKRKIRRWHSLYFYKYASLERSIMDWLVLQYLYPNDIYVAIPSAADKNDYPGIRDFLGGAGEQRGHFAS